MQSAASQSDERNRRRPTQEGNSNVVCTVQSVLNVMLSCEGRSCSLQPASQMKGIEGGPRRKEIGM